MASVSHTKTREQVQDALSIPRGSMWALARRAGVKGELRIVHGRAKSFYTEEEVRRMKGLKRRGKRE